MCGGEGALSLDSAKGQLPDIYIYVYIYMYYLRPKVGVTDQKSEIQPGPQNPNRIAQKRAPNGVEVLLQKPPLKAFLNPPNICRVVYIYRYRL